MLGRAANAIGELRRRLDESLFPAVPAGRSTIGRGERLILLLALLTLAIVLQLFRVGPTFALDGLWAEDGTVFFQGALSQGFAQAIFSTYAGYLVVVPRLIGELGALVPLRDAAVIVTLASATVVALSGLAVWYASAAHLRNPYLRGALVAVTILAPVASLEAVASASYVSWYMLFATFWLLLWRPPTTWGAALASLFVLATWLSNPGVLFFAPLAALRALAARDRRDLLILGAFALGAAVQVPVTISSDEGIVEPLWTSDILVTYLQRVVDGAVLGENLGGDAWAAFGWPFLIALLVCAFVGLAFGVMRSSSPARHFTAVALATSLVMFLISLYQRAAAPAMVWPPDTYFGQGGRYAIVPALLLVSAALVLIDQQARLRRGPSRLPRSSMAAIGVLLVATATSFDLRNGVARGTPPWSEAVKAAASACASERLAEIPVPTSPPGFGVTVSCDRLTSAYDRRGR